MRHHVLGTRDFKDSAFLLRLDRNNLEFEPGQYISIGTPGHNERRDYSIYSAPDEPFIELLIKEVEGGAVSKPLHDVRIGDELEVEGPLGEFTIPWRHINQQFLLIATGTGIAPFHSYVQNYPDLDYQILHGVKYPEQLYH